MPLFYEDPVHITRAEGVWLYDHEGRAYLDAYNNVPSVGHCHPRVVDAVARQAAQLNTHTRYLSEVVYAYAERLLATFPEALSNLLFTSSGAKRGPGLRMARYHTGGAGFIVTRFAYHGHSTAVAEITPAFGPGVPLGVHVRTVPAPPPGRSGEDVSQSFAAGIEQAIADLRRHGIRFAGAIFDSIFSSDGLYADPPGFLRAAAETVRRHGGVYIADEVQPGFGRTGAGMWGFSRHGITPDLVVMGKPGQRHADSGRGRAARADGLVLRALGLLQHLRRQHGLLRRRLGGAGRAPRRAADRAFRPGRPVFEGLLRTPATRRRAHWRRAARACTWASRSSIRRARPTRARRCAW